MRVKNQLKGMQSRLESKSLSAQLTCTHRHGRSGHHPHGSHAVVAGGGDGDRGRVEGRGGDAVRLHHGGVMDHMGLSRIHWWSVVRSLLGSTQDTGGVRFP